MWYTSTHVEEARELAKAWGFDVRTMKGLTWVKLNKLAGERFDKALANQQILDFHDVLDLLNAETVMNGGNYTRANSEDLLFAVRGAGLERASKSVKQIIYTCRDEHSDKPAEARFRLEELYGDVPRIELFARQSALGWHCWGDECDSSVNLIPGVAAVRSKRVAA
jgi:N6-adenosine-specific RNA methylase IME4